MLVYTSQNKDVWQQLSLTDRYLANPKNLNAMNNLDKNWQKAYRWMENKMSEKLNKPKKAIAPIWWWPVTKTLDNIQPYDEDQVIILAYLKENEYVASDFELWHYVLNRFYLHPNFHETEQEWDKTDESYQKLPTKQKHQLMLNSWNKVFTNKQPHNKDIQITSWQINLAQVFKIYDYNHNLLYKNHCPTNINPTNEVILWNKKQSQLQLANLKNTKQLMTI